MYIGMDIGGTNVRIAAAKSLQRPELLHRVSFPSSQSYAQNITAIIQAISKIDPQPHGIGFCMPGSFNKEKTMVTRASYVKQYIDRPIGTDLKQAFGCPVIMEHDTPTAGLGEALYGTHTDNDFCFLIYGTGTGGAFVTFKDGHPHSQKVTDEEHAAYLAPWQSECGGRGIENMYGKPAANLSEAEWERVMDTFYGYLVKFVKHFQPRTIVYGGGVATKQWPRLQNVVTRLHAEHPELPVDITRTILGEDAGLYGTFGLLRDM